MEHGYDKARIDALRAEALNGVAVYDEFYYHFYHHLRQTLNQASWEMRYANALHYSFEHTDVCIDDGELLVGKIASRAFTAAEQAEWENIRQYAMACSYSPIGQDSHMAIDYDLLLEKGVLGVLETIQGYRDALNPMDYDDLARDMYYESCARCLEGVLCFARRYADEAERMAKTCADEERAAELTKIAEACRRVPAHPPRSFHEALQSVHFLTFCLSNKPTKPSGLQYQLGRPDRYLWPFYKADLDAGRITPHEAQTLLDCLGVLINRRVNHGMSSGYMVGGRTADGQVVSNALTHMLMQVVAHVRLVYPAVGLCWCPDTPQEDLLLACRLLGEGHSHPAVFNDDVITEGLMHYGLPRAEACNYIHSTCVEITPIGASNIWVASPYTNLVQALLDVMDKEYPHMEALLEALFQNLSASIKSEHLRHLRIRHERQKYAIDPLLSCFVHNCLEKAQDIEAFGARYNWIMPSFVGLSNLADALVAIQALVFEEKALSFAQLQTVLKDDFEGHETVLKRIQALPKYGNDDDVADGYVRRLADWLLQEFEKYHADARTFMVPSLFCWIIHDMFGQETGASPDGRKSGFALGDGSGPAQGREQNGPTAAILSSTKWNHTNFIGGVAVNMKFAKNLFDENTVEQVAALVRTYMKRGGFEMQINVVDRDTLLQAQKHPEAYQDLIVRIGGYSDYFTRLSKTMQAEVLQRTEYSL